MRRSRSVIFALGALFLVMSTSASIRPMSLKEYMSISHEVLHGTIVAKETFRSDEPLPETVYTKLTIQGDALRGGMRGETTEVIFMGSHDPKDDFVHSEAPDLRDTRIGGEVVVFYFDDDQIHDKVDRGQNIVDNWQGVYRVERGFGVPVIIGKGDGYAFPANTRLDEAVRRIEDTHELIKAERLAAAQGSSAQPQAQK